MPRERLGILVIAAGVAVIVVGALIYAGALAWFGRLPGDVRIEGDRIRFYMPLATMVLVSLVLSLVAYVIRRFF